MDQTFEASASDNNIISLADYRQRFLHRDDERPPPPPRPAAAMRRPPEPIDIEAIAKTDPNLPRLTVSAA